MRQLNKVTFPVFKLPSAPYVTDGLVVTDRGIVDDTNQPFNTLGRRRLKSPHEMVRVSLYCSDFPDMLKRSKGKTYYIDNVGLLFYYQKTDFTKLYSHKINKILKKETYSLVYLDKIDYPFKVSRPPLGSFCSVLYYNEVPWLIYNSTEAPHKAKNIKV